MSSATLDSRLARLTPKEVACLRLVAMRMSSKEIASELGIAKTSVDTYCNRARVKLGVRGRQEAARLLRASLVAEAVADLPSDDRAEPRMVQATARSPLAAVTFGVLAATVVATLAAGALM